MTKANKDVFVYVFRWVAYVIAPIILGWYYYGTALLNGLWIEPSLFFVFTAAVCNAVMDTLSHHFDKSLFRGLNKQYWDASISWKNKYIDGEPSKGRRLFPVQISDGWHLFKTIMLISWGLAVVTYVPNFAWYWDLLIVGVVYNCYFSLFYKNIF